MPIHTLIRLRLVSTIRVFVDEFAVLRRFSIGPLIVQTVPRKTIIDGVYDLADICLMAINTNCRL